ncbi:unnamed protein product [[Candida] boidinii]|nr:unnamed protein product [[Candida] boidinii]
MPSHLVHSSAMPSRLADRAATGPPPEPEATDAGKSPWEAYESSWGIQFGQRSGCFRHERSERTHAGHRIGQRNFPISTFRSHIGQRRGKLARDRFTVSSDSNRPGRCPFQPTPSTGSVKENIHITER